MMEKKNTQKRGKTKKKRNFKNKEKEKLMGKQIIIRKTELRNLVEGQRHCNSEIMRLEFY